MFFGKNHFNINQFHFALGLNYLLWFPTNLNYYSFLGEVALSLGKVILQSFCQLLSILDLFLINFLEVELFWCLFLFRLSCLLVMLWNFFINNFSYSFLFMSQAVFLKLMLKDLSNLVFYQVFQVELWIIFVLGLIILFIKDFMILNFGNLIFISVIVYFINLNLKFIVIYF